MAKKSQPRDGSRSVAGNQSRLELELIRLVEQWRIDPNTETPATNGEQAIAAPTISPAAAKRLEEIADPQARRLCAHVLRECLLGRHAVAHPLRVGYLGPSHSYSHLAARERFGELVEFRPLATVSAVFEQVRERNLDFGVVPLENSTDGRIVDTLEMLALVPVKISAEIPLRIHHHLLATGPLSGIRRICSKPQAISQCRGWLASHLPKVEFVEMSSTAAAAEAAAKDASLAAIAGLAAATEYGLKILAERIEDNPHNVTRFAVIGQHAAPRTGNDKTGILFQVPHEPGALADAMQIFKRNRVNLTWIESFPRAGAHQEYYFLMELAGHERDLRIRKSLASLGKRAEKVTVLGSYPAIAIPPL